MPSPNGRRSASAPWNTPPRCEWFTTTLPKPAAARRSICHSMSGLPPTTRSGLGIWSVRGRSRSPRPAARIIACSMRASGGAAHFGMRALELVEKGAQPREIPVARGRLADVADETRRVREVTRLSIPIGQPREDSQHLDVPLHAHPFDVLPEIAEIGAHRQPGRAGPLPVANRSVEDALFIPADERVAIKAGDVVAHGAVHRVLEIEDSGIGVGHNEIARHVVAMHEY